MLSRMFVTSQVAMKDVAQACRHKHNQNHQDAKDKQLAQPEHPKLEAPGRLPLGYEQK
jgi:hypothetical protein